ncbi:hypothetical protein BDF22DRAFT_734857 [Syncephalis plumigaleata]|nr:hypothetical protein BDF22DRAFT_734857 [Syncephalis plumigaleata]
MSRVAARVLLNYSELPTITWSRKPKNLLQLISVEPNYGVGKRVADVRQKVGPDGETNTCYKIESAEFKVTKGELRNGEVKGRLMWKERYATAKPVLITAALKHDWMLLPAIKNPMDKALRAEEKRQLLAEEGEEAVEE